MAEHRIVWEFRPCPDRVAEFERAYASDGPWARLFARSAGFLGTELHPPSDERGWYRTVDRWDSVESHADFLRTHAAEYARLDRACTVLTSAERRVE